MSCFSVGTPTAYSPKNKMSNKEVRSAGCGEPHRWIVVQFYRRSCFIGLRQLETNISLFSTTKVVREYRVGCGESTPYSARYTPHPVLGHLDANDQTTRNRRRHHFQSPSSGNERIHSWMFESAKMQFQLLENTRKKNVLRIQANFTPSFAMVSSNASCHCLYVSNTIKSSRYLPTRNW